MAEAAVDSELGEPEAATTTDNGSNKKRGISGNPRGVSGPNKSGKFVARASFKPPGESKAHQRAVGSFESADAAGSAVMHFEAELAAGRDPWAAAARINKHKRGEVRGRVLHK